MTDLTSAPKRYAQRRSVEFHVYFTIILFAAIPFTSVAWMRDVLRYQTLNLSGPLARAWQEADKITPILFTSP